MLFEKYTIPSVINQTDMDFDWLVLFSESTPEQFKKIVLGYQNEIRNFHPIYISDDKANNFRNIIVEYIKNDTDEELIVTTRCDNDDALSKKYIEQVHKNMWRNSEYILSFPNGYQYDEKTKVLRKYYFPTSHFTTLISNKKDKTIYDFLHMDISENCNVEYINTEPLWLEVIHSENVYNCMGSIHFSDYVRKYNLEFDFNVPLSGNRNIFSLFFLYVFFALHKLYVKRDRISVAIKRRMGRKK